MKKTLKVMAGLALSLAVAGCSASGQSAGPSNDAALEAQLETAVVEVATDACVGNETISLLDAASGEQLMVDTQSEPADATACGQGPSALAFSQ